MNTKSVLVFGRFKAVAVSFFALCATALLGSCGSDVTPGSLDKGRDFLVNRNYPAAVIELKNVVQQSNADEPAARYLLGLALKETEDYGGAEIELRKAIDLGLTDDNAYVELLTLLEEMGQYRKIADEFEKIGLSTDAARANVLALACQALLALGESKAATKTCQAAENLDPSPPRVKLALAKLSEVTNDLEVARKLAEEALRGNPDDPSTILYTALLRRAQGDRDGAIELGERLASRRPLSPRGYLVAVPLHLEKKDAERARTLSMKLVKATKEPGPIGAYLLALVNFADSREVEARELVQVSLKALPSFGPALALAGRLELGKANYAQAQAYLLKALDDNPGNAYARKLLTSSYLKAGAVEQAMEQLEALKKASPSDPAVWKLSGELEILRGNYAAALAAFARGRDLDPTDSNARVQLAQVKLLAGDRLNAIAELRSEIDSNQNDENHHALTVLVLHSIRAGAPSKVLPSLDAAIEKSSKSPLLYNLKGMTLRAMGEVEGAREQFRTATALDGGFYPAVQNLAMTYSELGEYDAAERLYRSFIGANPRHEEALLGIVDVALRREARYEDRLRAIDDLLTALPDSVKGHLLKIQFLQASSRFGEALKVAEAAVTAVPGEVRLLEALAHSQRMSGHSDHAIQTYNQVILQAPSTVNPYLRQAEIHAARAEWEAARSILTRGLKNVPDSMELQLARFRLSVLRGEFETALKEARELQKAQPLNPLGYVAEADAYMANKRADQAIDVLKNAQRRIDVPQLVLRLFGILLSNKGADEANGVVSDWMSRHRGDPAVPASIAASYLSKKDWNMAVHWYKIALTISPQSPEFLNNLAWALGKLGDNAGLEYARDAHRLAPGDPAILETLGVLQLRAGRVEEALSSLEKAVKIEPGRMDFRLSLAKAYKAARRTESLKKQIDILDRSAVPSEMRKEMQLLRSH